MNDKKLFLKEYELIKDKIDKTLQILGDKSYIGLEEYNVNFQKKHNELEYKKDKFLTNEKNKN